MQQATAIVTGAAKGIGKAIACRLVEDGFRVVIADTDDAEGEKTSSELGNDHCHFIACDVGKENEVKVLFEQTLALGSGIEVVVNNAGIIRDKKIWNLSADDFDTVLNINLRGTWLMCREAARLMKEQMHGRIINISSRAWLGNPGQSNYSASKAGVVSLTRVLALELGKYNVLVNAVAPGLIDTPLTQNLDKEVLQKLIEAQPTKSMGKAEDVARVVSFLADEKTQFITGQVIYVDGGKNIGSNMI